MSSLAIDPGVLARELRAASAQERELWSKVKGKHRGQAGHDAKAWDEWMLAASRVQFLARLARGAASGTQPQKRSISWR